MPKDDEFLREYFVDCQKEMRWRREPEYRLLRTAVVLYPVLVTAVVGINELVQDKRIFSTLAVAMAVLLTTLTTYGQEN